MIKLQALILTILIVSVTAAAQSRSRVIQLEEPTGIERRDNEVVSILAQFTNGEARAGNLRIIDDKNQELPLQIIVRDSHPDGSIKSAEILFPATLIPGRLPRYQLLELQTAGTSPQQSKGGDYKTDLISRRLGTTRFELGNSRFSVIINLGKD